MRNCIRRQIRTYALKMMPYHFQSREDKSLRPPRRPRSSWGWFSATTFKKSLTGCVGQGLRMTLMWEGPELGFSASKKGQGEHRKQEHFPLQVLPGPPRGVAAGSLSCLLSWHWKLDSVVDHTQPLLSR